MREHGRGLREWPRMPATRTIAAVTVAIHVAGMLSPDLQRLLFDYGAQVPELVAAGEWHRLITSAFLHSHEGSHAVSHVLFNMAWLWILGSELESRTGSAGFVAVYFATAVAGSATAHAFGHGGIGASGAIYGLLGLSAFNFVAGAAPHRWQVAKGWLVLLVYGLSMPLWAPDGERIGWAAHLGGLAAGLVIAAAWWVIVRRRNTLTLRPLVPAAVGGLSLVLLFAGPAVHAPVAELAAMTARSDGPYGEEWYEEARETRLRAAFGDDLITADAPAHAASSITIDPHAFGVFDAGDGMYDFRASIEVQTTQTQAARRALEAAGQRWFLTDDEGREWSTIDELAESVTDGNDWPWIPEYVSDIETTEAGLEVSVDLEGEAATPAMQETFLRVLLEEFDRAGVTTAHVRPGRY
jgi:membrane associated rhomboid family serine protease